MAQRSSRATGLHYGLPDTPPGASPASYCAIRNTRTRECATPSALGCDGSTSTACPMMIHFQQIIIGQAFDVDPTKVADRHMLNFPLRQINHLTLRQSDCSSHLINRQIPTLRFRFNLERKKLGQQLKVLR